MRKKYIYSDGTDEQHFGTEKEAIWTFCEYLIEDSSRRYPRYPVGTVLSVRKGERTILHYQVGYTSDDRPRK